MLLYNDSFREKELVLLNKLLTLISGLVLLAGTATAAPPCTTRIFLSRCTSKSFFPRRSFKEEVYLMEKQRIQQKQTRKINSI